MPVRIDVSKAQKKNDNHVQYIPCSIDYSGNAEVETHFSANVSVKEEEEEAGMCKGSRT